MRCKITGGGSEGWGRGLVWARNASLKSSVVGGEPGWTLYACCQLLGLSFATASLAAFTGLQSKQEGSPLQAVKRVCWPPPAAAALCSTNWEGGFEIKYHADAKFQSDFQLR